jgi:hypothetical protein
MTDDKWNATLDRIYRLVNGRLRREAAKHPSEDQALIIIETICPMLIDILVADHQMPLFDLAAGINRGLADNDVPWRLVPTEDRH